MMQVEQGMTRQSRTVETSFFSVYELIPPVNWLAKPRFRCPDLLFVLFLPCFPAVIPRFYSGPAGTFVHTMLDQSNASATATASATDVARLNQIRAAYLAHRREAYRSETRWPLSSFW